MASPSPSPSTVPRPPRSARRRDRRGDGSRRKPSKEAATSAGGCGRLDGTRRHARVVAPDGRRRYLNARPWSRYRRHGSASPRRHRAESTLEGAPAAQPRLERRACEYSGASLVDDRRMSARAAPAGSLPGRWTSKHSPTESGGRRRPKPTRDVGHLGPHQQQGQGRRRRHRSGATGGSAPSARSPAPSAHRQPARWRVRRQPGVDFGKEMYGSAKTDVYDKKASTVFEGGADLVRAWAEPEQRSHGAQQGEAHRPRRRFGDLLKPMGSPAEQPARCRPRGRAQWRPLRVVSGQTSAAEVRRHPRQRRCSARRTGSSSWAFRSHRTR